MPSLGHLTTGNAVWAAITATMGGFGVGGSPGRGLYTNLVRLTDKSIEEYEAARLALDAYVNAPTNQTRPFTSCSGSFDHLENCIESLHRLGVHAKALTYWQGKRLHCRNSPVRRAETSYGESATQSSTPTNGSPTD